jgi:hypothetical protein
VRLNQLPNGQKCETHQILKSRKSFWNSIKIKRNTLQAYAPRCNIDRFRKVFFSVI